MKLTDKIEFFNEDCMAVMARYPDNHFDLAIVDPPYGINIGGESGGKIGGDKPFGKRGFEKAGKNKYVDAKVYHVFKDEKPPEKEYFNELLRISKNQIIFGANHFISQIPFDSSCWIVWDKDNSGNFADCELAWTSFKTSVRKFKWRWNGMLQQNMKDKEIRIHPTQKPVKLYEWLLKNYSAEGQKILDTHLGSGSSAIAAHYFGVELVGCEIDKEYFNDSVKRFKHKTSQLKLL